MIRLLILSGEPILELREYFKKREFEILLVEDPGDYSQIDYILVDSEYEVKSTSERYSADKNEISILCLGQVKDYRAFLTFNGRFNLDENFLESDIGELVLDRFFSSEYSLHLSEKFNEILGEQESFKITNHLSSGLYLDELSISSFKAGFNLVSLRSYMDHILTYFTYLKQSSLAGVPYEVEYSHNEDFFVVNTYLTVRNFFAEYMIDSFGNVNSKQPLNYLLGVAARSTDFMEITYFDNPGRLALTAIWSKDNKQYSNSIAFNNVKTHSQSLIKVDRKIKNYRNVEEEIKALEEGQDLLINRNLPGGIMSLLSSEREDGVLVDSPEESIELIAFIIAKIEDEQVSVDDLDEGYIETIIKNEFADNDYFQALKDSDYKELLQKIQNKNITKAISEEVDLVRASMDEDEGFKEEIQSSLHESISEQIGLEMKVDSLNRILGSSDEMENSAKIKGSEEAEVFSTLVRGLREDKDSFTKIFHGDISDLSSGLKQIVSGSHDPLENKGLLRNLINSKINDIESRAASFFPKEMSRYVKSVLPREIELGLSEYTNSIGKTIDDLSAVEIENVEKNVLPAIVESLLADESLAHEYSQKIISNQDESSDREMRVFEKSFKGKIESKLEKRNDVEKSDGAFVLTETQFSGEELQNLVKETIKETLEDEFSLDNASKIEIQEKEKLIIRNLTHSMKESKKEIEQIVRNADRNIRKIEKERAINHISSDKGSDFKNKSNVDNELLKRVKESETENKKLKIKVNLLEGRLRSEEIIEERMESINDKVGDSLNDQSFESTIDKDTSVDEKKAELLIQNLKDEETTVSSIERVSELLENEKKLAQDIANYQLELKKEKHKVSEKERLYKLEIKSIEKKSTGKDIVLERIKSTLSEAIKKKDSENKKLFDQIEELNKKSINDKTATLKKVVLDLKKDNELLAKSAEMFKSRLEIMVKPKPSDKNEVGVDFTIEENRSLNLENSQLINQFSTLKKDLKLWERKLDKSKELELKLKNENVALKSSLSRSGEEIAKARLDEAKKFASINQANKKKNEASDSKEVSALKVQNHQLQKKIKELTDNSKSGTAVGAGQNKIVSPKEKLLERDKKRLQSDVVKLKADLDDNKKAVNKFKGENTKLQHAADKYIKDIDRLTKQIKSLSGKKAA